MKHRLLQATVISAVVGCCASSGSARGPGDPCTGLRGAAAGLCTAYCRAQDCAGNASVSCMQLRTNFRKITGRSLLPCDAFCGDGQLDQANEECDDGNDQVCDGCTPNCRREFCGDGVVCPTEQCEPGDVCAEGGACQEDCTCPMPMCGNAVAEAGEECDAPDDDSCPGGCQADCTCAPTAGGCGNATAPACDGACPAGQACVPTSDACLCAPMSVSCGVVAGAPLCLGACPTDAPVCRTIGAACQCSPF
jgi:cysteine-rich repeat protein